MVPDSFLKRDEGLSLTGATGFTLRYSTAVGPISCRHGNRFPKGAIAFFVCHGNIIRANGEHLFRRSLPLAYRSWGCKQRAAEAVDKCAGRVAR